MNDEVIVQYLGFQASQLVREYSFQVREAGTEREFLLSIANEALVSHRVRYQDAPEICAQTLQAELVAHTNQPSETEHTIAKAELDTHCASRVNPGGYPSGHPET